MVLIHIHLKANQKDMDKRISINQFVEFGKKKSKKSKLTLIKNQKFPKNFLSFWYKTAFACIRRCLLENGSLVPIYRGIELLKIRAADTETKQRNNTVSIEALERFLNINLPKFLSTDKVEKFKVEQKWVEIDGVKLFLSPELIFKVKRSNGDSVIGAFKIHICKQENKFFDFQMAEMVATQLHNYLVKTIDEKETVDPKLCFSIDVFGKRIVSASTDTNRYDEEIHLISKEISELWDIA